MIHSIDLRMCTNLEVKNSAQVSVQNVEDMDSSSFETAKELFSILDVQQKGFILIDELSKIGDEFSDSQLHSVFAALDKDGEGKITLKDFADAFMSLSRRDDDENKRNNGEYPSHGCTEQEGGSCLPLHANLKYDSDLYVNEDSFSRSGIFTDLQVDENKPSLQGEIHTDKHVEKFGELTETNGEQMIGETTERKDDVFEGEGLLHVDQQVYSTSPSRPQYLRSPTLRKKRTNLPPESGAIDRKGPEITDRSPPDGNEGDTCLQRISSAKSRKIATRERHKSVKTQVCMPYSGFAREAIVDMLKIVDAHTISNLGLYDNRNNPSQQNVIMDSSDILDNNMHSDVDNWSHQRHTGGEYRDLMSRDPKYYETLCPEQTSTGFRPMRINSQGISLPSEQGSADFVSEDESTDSRLSMFSPSSVYSDFACSLETHSESESTHHINDKDSHSHIIDSENQTRLIGTHALDHRSPSIGAKIDRETIGNLIFENDEEQHEDLYDRILNLSGVELNSRLSSSESSLHDLILEAEVAKKSAALLEDWDSVMKRINGVSIFGG